MTIAHCSNVRVARRIKSAVPSRLALLAVVVLAVSPLAGAQKTSEAQALILRAVAVELEAAKVDNSLWRYRMSEKQENDSVYDEVDTAHGGIKRKIEQAGKPLSPEQQAAESAKILAFVQDPKAQAKQRKDGEHDDASAAKMLNLLPRAFHWEIVSQTPEQTILHFVPDPAFDPPDIESRVLSSMIGDLIVDKRQYRITTIRGRLSHDVNIGYGLLGRLREGGTFNVERRQLAPNIWQITETHVHIDGRALLFKTIGQQTDEVKTAFKPVPQSTTLAEAAAMLGAK